MTDRLPAISGNAHDDGQKHAHWFIGHFLAPADNPRHSDAVEIKWGMHAEGEGQQEWTYNERATTLSILVRGRTRLSLGDDEIVLEREGDYALWFPGTPHRWVAEEESVVITVRWPSIPGDSHQYDGS